MYVPYSSIEPIGNVPDITLRKCFCMQIYIYIVVYTRCHLPVLVTLRLCMYAQYILGLEYISYVYSSLFEDFPGPGYCKCPDTPD